jgi:hypothetical protein
VADEFTDREMYEQAWGNMVSSAAALHEFLTQRSIDPSEFWTFFGETYAPVWAEARGDLKKVAHYVALNLTSVGCTTETTHDGGKATVRATWSGELDDPDWRIPAKPALVEMTSSFGPIMSWLGLNFSWEETSDGMVFHLAE